ncbi:MAG TPA: PorV/PorQ family protein [bacterium]|nr:PorV/PorQ family protein [bacterium]
MKHRVIRFLPSLVLTGLLSSFAADGFDFLRITYGGRAAALGGAYSAADGDVQSLAFNPATLSGSENHRLVFSYIDYLADIQSGFLGYQLRLAGHGILAVTAAYLNYGTLPRTGVQGEDLGTFTPGDLAIGVSYADSLKCRIRWGTTVKYIRSAIDAYSADALALDAGAVYHIPVHMLNIGLSVQNLGRTLRPFIDVKETLPLAFRAGFSKHLAHLPLVISGDVIRYARQESDLIGGMYFATGGEFTVSDFVLLRFGYHSRGAGQKMGTEAERMAGLSFGFGLRLRRILIDYAFGSHGALGDTNHFTVSMTL